MSLTARKNKLIAAIAAVVIMVGGAAAWHAQASSHKAAAPAVKTAAVQPAATTELTYDGQQAQTVLALLKKHAKVQTKTSGSLGEFVVSINGNDGGGKKYWTFYVNGQEAQVGAGSYVTRDSDHITWRLQ